MVDISIEYLIPELELEDDSDETYNGPLAGLCHELEKMVDQNVVETIELLMWVRPGYDCSRWGELDDVLMGSPHSEGWPALKKVSFFFKVIKTFTDDKKVNKALHWQESPMA